MRTFSLKNNKDQFQGYWRPLKSGTASAISVILEGVPSTLVPEKFSVQQLWLGAWTFLNSVNARARKFVKDVKKNDKLF
jgi:hypothetical protein